MPREYNQPAKPRDKSKSDVPPRQLGKLVREIVLLTLEKHGYDVDEYSANRAYDSLVNYLQNLDEE